MYGFKMDGTTYDVDIIEIDINVSFLNKYAERTADNGELKSEALGTFENQTIVLGPGSNYLNPDYIQLYEDLIKIQSDGTFNHVVEVFSPIGRYDFKMYPADFSIKLKRIKDDDLDRDLHKKYWSNMTLKFIATNRRE